jgi:hypothetical protein
MSDIGRVARQIMRRLEHVSRALAATYDHEDPHAFRGTQLGRPRTGIKAPVAMLPILDA